MCRPAPAPIIIPSKETSWAPSTSTVVFWKAENTASFSNRR